MGRWWSLEVGLREKACAHRVWCARCDDAMAMPLREREIGVGHGRGCDCSHFFMAICDIIMARLLYCLFHVSVTTLKKQKRELCLACTGCLELEVKWWEPKI
jgi:hypothetical protein